MSYRYENKLFFRYHTCSFLRTCVPWGYQEGPLPMAALAGTTIHRTFTHDVDGETWTDELEGRPIHNGTLLELPVRGGWVPVLYLRYRKFKRSVPLLIDQMHLRWPPPFHAPGRDGLPGSCSFT